MDSRTQLTLYVALGVAVSAVSIHSLSQREPSHDGRGLTAWLGDFDEGTSEAYQRASDAIDGMGTNTLSRLLSLLQSKDTPLDRAMDRMADSQSMVEFDWETAFDRHWQALRGFEALGGEAKPAIPELAQRLERGENPEFVSFALARIGIDSLPVLKAATTNENAWVRRASTAALGILGKDAQDAIPALVDRLKDANAFVRRNAAETLGRIGDTAREAIPALKDASTDGDGSVSRAAEDALGKIALR